MSKNLWRVEEDCALNEEFFEPLIRGGVLIERIISKGQVTPAGQWYDQDLDEWVVLLQGSAEIDFEAGHKIQLRAGDWLLIQAHQRHRVVFTSSEPPCIWLAVHGAELEAAKA